MELIYNDKSISSPTLLSMSDNGADGFELPIVKALDNEYEEIVKPTGNGFPLEVFNPNIKTLILELRDKYNYPIDYSSISILSASSTAIGAKYKVKMKEEWLEKCNLYAVLVGEPGTIKSHPMSFAFSPIERRDKDFHSSYKVEMASFTTQQQDKENKEKLLEKPIYKETIIDDFTPEALGESHSNNPRGISIVVDELKGWLNNFDRYSSGSEEQLYLTLWSGKSRKISRVSKDTIRLEDPFVNVIGTIQPKLIDSFAKGDKADNGFLDRMLFVHPKEDGIGLWNDLEVAPIHLLNYNNMINTLFDLDRLNKHNDNNITSLLLFSPEAILYLTKWQNAEEIKLKNRYNNYELPVFKKIQIYAIRFCAILHLQDVAINTTYSNYISLDIVKRAIVLAEFFRKNTLDIRDSLEDPKKFTELSNKQKEVLFALPKTFSKNDGVKIAEKNEMPTATFSRFLKKKKLFKNISHGFYEKLV